MIPAFCFDWQQATINVIACCRPIESTLRPLLHTHVGGITGLNSVNRRISSLFSCRRTGFSGTVLVSYTADKLYGGRHENSQHTPLLFRDLHFLRMLHAIAGSRRGPVGDSLGAGLYSASPTDVDLLSSGSRTVSRSVTRSTAGRWWCNFGPGRIEHRYPSGFRRPATRNQFGPAEFSG